MQCILSCVLAMNRTLDEAVPKELHSVKTSEERIYFQNEGEFSKSDSMHCKR